MIQTLIAAVVGWVLGLASPQITASLDRRRIAEAIRGPLESEMRDLRERSASVAYYILRKGALTKELLQWAVDSIAAADTGRSVRLIHNLRQMLALPDDQFAAVAGVRDDDTGGTFVPRIDAPFLRAKVEHLDVFAPRVQRDLLQITYEISMFNETVDDLRLNHSMTFDASIVGENAARVQDNHRRAHLKCGQRARLMADRCGDAIASLNAPRSRKWWRL